MLATIKTLKLENLNEFFRNKILIHAVKFKIFNIEILEFQLFRFGSDTR